MLNLVSAVTNLSFYAGASRGRGGRSVEPFSSVAGGGMAALMSTNIVYHNRERLSRALVPLLLHANTEAVVESARAFGNFSRHKEVRIAEGGVVSPVCVRH